MKEIQNFDVEQEKISNAKTNNITNNLNHYNNNDHNLYNNNNNLNEENSFCDIEKEILNFDNGLKINYNNDKYYKNKTKSIFCIKTNQLGWRSYFPQTRL